MAPTSMPVLMGSWAMITIRHSHQRLPYLKNPIPHFSDSDYLFYGNNYIDEQSRDFSQTDIQSWSEYLVKALTKEKIKYYLYDKEALKEIH